MKRLRLCRVRVFAVVLSLTFLLGAAARISGAWWERNTGNPDFGIVALMAKHMAEGTELPVFFYGQPYMGSVEPMASALLCRLFGYSGFAVCLGTALWGFLLLPLLYRWASDMGGRLAGWAAVTFAAIGSTPYFHYQCSPRGGYAAALLLGSLVLWLAGDIVYAERQQTRPRAVRYLSLGIFAGLGWWANQLVTPALAAAALLFPLVLGWRCFSMKLLAGIAGFLMGSLPFWIWNMNNGWATFRFSESITLDTVGKNIGRLLTTRIAEILGIVELPVFVRVAVCLLGGITVLALAWTGIRRWRRLGFTRAGIHGLCMILFVLFFVLAFSVSKYAGLNTPRYALPLVPVAAVLIGLVFRQTGPRGRVPAVMLLIGVIVYQGWQVYWEFAPRAALQAEWVKHHRVFADRIRELGLRDIYAGYEHHILDAILEEEFCFSDVTGERYGPYAERLENAPSPAVFENYGLINQFVEASGGTAETFSIGDTTITYNLRPPEEGLVELSGDWIREWVDSRKQNLGKILRDRQLDTVWSSEGLKDGTGWLEVRLREPVRLARLRMLALESRYPEVWRVEGALADGKWKLLTPEMANFGYYWSGPRLYYGGDALRLDVKLADKRVDRLRIYVSRAVNHGSIEIGEIQLLVAGEHPPSEMESVDALVKRLQELAPTRLLCDRWIANELRKVGPKGLKLPQEQRIHRVMQGEAGLVFERLTASCMLLVRRENGQACRDVLSECGIEMTEEVIGPWLLFRFGPGQWTESDGLDYGLCWKSAELQIGSSRRMAYGLLAAARLKEAASPSDALVLYERALRHYPNCQPAVAGLARVHLALGAPETAAQYQTQAERMWVPTTTVNVAFGGLTLTGVDIQPNPTHPGSMVTIRYYWTYRPGVSLKNWVCFVHFRDGKETRFQDDHKVLKDVDYSYQPEAEVFVEERTVRVPETATAGEYTMVLGVYDHSRNDWRVKPKTTLPVKNRAVQMPVGIQIATPNQ